MVILVIFHCYVSLPEGNLWIHKVDAQHRSCPHPHAPAALLPCAAAVPRRCTRERGLHEGNRLAKGDASGIRENTDARYLGVAIFRSLAICILVGTG